MKFASMNVRSKKYRILLMSLGITFLAILLFLMIPLSYRISLPAVYWVHQALLFVLLVTLTFINTKWLAPKFLFQRRFVLYYFILFVACILIVVFLQQMEVWLKIPEAIKSITSENGSDTKHSRQGHSVSFYIFLVEVLVLGVNISAIIIKKWEEEKEKRLEVEKDKVEIELSFLKSQINPHFFFNSLNTINALTYSDVNLSRVALKKLGIIMRYVLYNTSNKDATIEAEIEFIENYLELMRMRSSRRVSITFTANVVQRSRIIAPMLFLPFIENCFKHGVSGQVESPIEIWIAEEKGNIVFFAKNKIFGTAAYAETEHSHGIGIENTKRRLELLYPNKYTLSITKEKNFEVLLKINLNEN